MMWLKSTALIAMSYWLSFLVEGFVLDGAAKPYLIHAPLADDLKEVLDRLK